MVYGVDWERLHSCVRGKPDGTREYAFAVKRKQN
jgi:hypothetical protein